MKHLISLISALWVAINLLCGLIVLLAVSLVSLLVPVPLVSRCCTLLIKRIYRFAVLTDSFWMKQIVGIKLVIKGEPNTHPTPVVICNHQSWFDIPLIQDLISGNGPVVKFLIKREIAWVPIIGWICLALNMPRLRRNKSSGDRQNDYSIIQKVSKSHGDDSGALLVFPEGTRYSEQKRTTQQAPYQHLLKPRAGGLKMIKQHASADTNLVDITINYHKKNVRIWDCLHGDPRLITITVEHFKLSEIDDVETWLNNRWSAKDQIMSE